MKTEFPTSTRPLEFVALLTVELSTKEGPAYLYVAYDPFLDKLFNVSVEKENSDRNLLKSIYFLAEDPLFTEHIKNGFTLVLEDQHELSSSIESILSPLNGRCKFDKPFNNHLANPILENLVNFLNKKNK